MNVSGFPLLCQNKPQEPVVQDVLNLSKIKF